MAIPIGEIKELDSTYVHALPGNLNLISCRNILSTSWCQLTLSTRSKWLPFFTSTVTSSCLWFSIYSSYSFSWPLSTPPMTSATGSMAPPPTALFPAMPWTRSAQACAANPASARVMASAIKPSILPRCTIGEEHARIPPGRTRRVFL